MSLEIVGERIGNDFSCIENFDAFTHIFLEIAVHEWVVGATEYEGVDIRGFEWS